MKQRKKPVHRESELQQGCIKWFDLQYPKLRQILFAVPNGGSRDPKEAKRMGLEGIRPGVADLVFAMPNKQYHGLFIEMKAGKNVQSPEQLVFEAMVKARGYRYELCYTFERFRECIEEQLAQVSKSSNI